MMKNFSLVLTFYLIFIQTALSAQDDHSKKSNYQKIFKNMSLEQKVGQLFLFGTRDIYLSQKLEKKIKSYMPGGFILFGHNIKNMNQTTSFLYKIKKYYSKQGLPPPFLSVDQEGGRVTRIKTQPYLPSALSVGLTNDSYLASEFGKYIAKTLSLTGFNMNLAPVLDLANPHKRSFIGTRSFGDNSNNVSKLLYEFTKSMKNENIVPVAKHFPTHGDLNSDSHYELPIVNKNLSELLNKDLVPYKNLIKENLLGGIMVAHVAFPKLTRTKIPATFSKVIMTNLLKDQLSFPNLVVTDDIQMGGAKGIGNASQRALKALLSGADVIMVAWNLKDQIRAYRGVLSAAKRNLRVRRRVEQSALKIVRIKDEYQFFQPLDLPKLNNVKEHLRGSEIKVFIQKLSDSKIKKARPILDKMDLSRKAPLFVFSKRSTFRHSLCSSFQNPHCRPVSLSYKKFKQALVQSKKLKSSTSIIYINDKLSLRRLNQIPLSLRKSFVVINALAPSKVRENNNYKSVIHLASPLAGFASNLGMYLRKRQSVRTIADKKL